MEDLSVQPYMFEPEENEDDEPAQPRLQMDASQWWVTVPTSLYPSVRSEGNKLWG